MKLRVLVATGVLGLAALGYGTTAGAGPTPLYTVTCGPTGFTQATWQRAKLASIKFEWVLAGGNSESTEVPVAKTPPKGSATASPADSGSPTGVTVTYTRADGSSDPPVPKDCA